MAGESASNCMPAFLAWVFNNEQAMYNTVMDEQLVY